VAALLFAAVLVSQAVISVRTELVAVPVAAYFPQTPDQVVTVAAAVAARLRDQYTLGFAPVASAGVPGFRTITVRVIAAGRGRLRIHTRSGYTVSP